jgi:predicted  nucleic acid-binding Zn-ribbon protein
LEPMTAKVTGLKKELNDLESKRARVNNEVVKVEKSKQLLAESVKEKERRERDLSARVVKLEEKLQTDEERLAVARKDLNILSSLGITFDELSGITERIKGVAHRHNIDPKVSYNRLLTELEQMDKGLSLETLIEQRNNELQKVDSVIVKSQEKSTTLCNQNRQLQQELSTLKAQIADESETISRELKTITGIAQKVVEESKRKLNKGVQESLNEVANLKTEAMEAGRECGRLEAMIKQNNWVEPFVSILKGEDTFSESELRIMFIMILRSLRSWFERHKYSATITFSLKNATNNLITEIERWNPETNSVGNLQK